MLYLFYYTSMVLVPANCLTFLLQLNAIHTNQSIDKVGMARPTSVAPICSLCEMDVYLKMNFVIT